MHIEGKNTGKKYGSSGIQSVPALIMSDAFSSVRRTLRISPSYSVFDNILFCVITISLSRMRIFIFIVLGRQASELLLEILCKLLRRQPYLISHLRYA